MSDSTDRLIVALQSCFSDLIRRQEEQADKIHKALEALKPPAPTTDHKTAFWNSYMKLADEHDKELQQKYSTDLDTALIFAGLFSAVSSAFIIQIQPLIIGTIPAIIVAVQSLLYLSLFTTLLAALLAVLGKQWIFYYQAAGSRGTIEERGHERQRKLDGLLSWKFDLVLQTFPLLLQLALLLFSVALAVYLWTVHHSIAIIVLTLTSFGFISYISLLGSAIFSPDSPFQTPLAPFLGQIIPTTLRVARRTFIKLVHFSRSICSSSRAVKSRKQVLPRFIAHTRASDEWSRHPEYFSPQSSEVPAVVWILETSTDPTMVSVAAEMALHLQWPLDLDLTSSMARLVDTFNSCFDTGFKGGNFTHQVRPGMTHCAITCGRAYCSLRLIARASGIFHAEPDLNGISDGDVLQVENNDPSQLSHLRNVVRIASGSPDLVPDREELLAIRWALHTIPSLYQTPTSDPFPLREELEDFLSYFSVGRMPSLDQSAFTNYLCCLNSLLARTNPRIMAQLDKRRFQIVLMADLFKTLQVTHLERGGIMRIINTTAQLARAMIEPKDLGPMAIGRESWRLANLLAEASRFCHKFHLDPESLNVLTAVATLVRVENIRDLEELQAEVGFSPEAQQMEWLYATLEDVQRVWEEQRRDTRNPEGWDSDTILEVESLLQILACAGPDGQPHKPTVKSLLVILQALSRTDSNISYSAYLVLHASQSWFEDPELRPIMQQYSLWMHLGRITLKYQGRTTLCYLEMGDKLAKIPAWKQALHADLPTWLTVFSENDEWKNDFHSQHIFIFVIRSVWLPDVAEDDDMLQDTTEESWAVAIMALSKVWNVFDFNTPHAFREFLRLIRCTVSTSLQVNCFDWFKAEHFPPDIRAVFSSQLGKTLTKAAETARKTTPEDGNSHILHNTHAVKRVADLLRVLGKKISTEFEPASGNIQLGGSRKRYEDWEELRKHFENEINAVEQSLNPNSHP
ncbi:hypothetical protein C8R44DRAFT_984939 [Mycena epipterygia]|nr:hypothetical protein C8R44DRAFT_984939 [Mycena epipterygia]